MLWIVKKGQYGSFLRDEWEYNFINSVRRVSLSEGYLWAVGADWRRDRS
jgi:hypothetical protein